MNYVSLLVYLAMFVSLAAAQNEETAGDETPVESDTANSNEKPKIPKMPNLQQIMSNKRMKALNVFSKNKNSGQEDEAAETSMDTDNARPGFPGMAMLPHMSKKNIMPMIIPIRPKASNVEEGEESDMPSKPKFPGFPTMNAKKLFKMLPTTVAANDWRAKMPGVLQAFGKDKKGGIKKGSTHVITSTTETIDAASE